MAEGTSECTTWPQNARFQITDKYVSLDSLKQGQHNGEQELQFNCLSKGKPNLKEGEIGVCLADSCVEQEGMRRPLHPPFTTLELLPS